MRPLTLLLLPLLVLLLFGNCGGGVTRALSDLGPARQRQLQGAVERRQQRRAQARATLRGAARYDELRRIERDTDRQVDSLRLDDFQQRKWRNRRGKMERQLRQRMYPAPGRPATAPIMAAPRRDSV